MVLQVELNWWRHRNAILWNDDAIARAGEPINISTGVGSRFHVNGSEYSERHQDYIGEETSQDSVRYWETPQKSQALYSLPQDQMRCRPSQEKIQEVDFRRGDNSGDFRKLKFLKSEELVVGRNLDESSNNYSLDLSTGKL